MLCTIILKYLVNGWDVVEKKFNDVPYAVATLGATDALLVVYDTTMSDVPVFMVPLTSVVSVETIYGVE